MTADLLNAAGLYPWQRADHAQPGALYERALAISEATRVPTTPSPSTARSLNNLALVLRAQRDLDGARGLHERAL